MKNQKIALDTALIGAAFLLGLTLRLSDLGAAPLSDWEAGWAMQALNLAARQPAAIILSTQPGYTALTAVLFSLFESSNFMARFWPAIAGSLLVVASFFISRPGRPHLLTQTQAVILAFGLACTPGLVISSRIPGSPAMALSFLLLGASLVYDQRPISGGFFVGLALISGPAGPIGLAVLALAWWLARRISKPGEQSALQEAYGQPGPFPARIEWKSGLLAAIVTIVLAGTLLFRYPLGLAGFASAIPEYLNGFIAQADVPAARLTIALLFYQPLVVIFSLVGIGRSLIRPITWKDKFLVAFCLIWAAIAAALAWAYPSRQVFDLIWVITPLLVIACWEIAHYLPGRAGAVPVISVIQAAMLIILMGLAWFTLASLVHVQPGAQEYTARLVVVAGVLALAGLTTVLISLGWSWEAARLGLAAGTLGALGLFSISALWGAAYIRPNQPQELWHPAPAAGEAQILLKTIHDLSYQQTGRPDSLEIVSEIDAPSLRWLLRDFNNVKFVEKSNPNSMPSVLLTRQIDSPALLADYRGQDFDWWLYPASAGQTLANAPAWFAYRTAPIQAEKLILWARSDLFPGGSLGIGSPPPSPQEIAPGAAEIPP